MTVTIAGNAMVRSSSSRPSTFRLVTISMAIASAHSFVHPRGTSLSHPSSWQAQQPSERPTCLSMSVSLPDDKSHRWDGQSPVSSSHDAGESEGLGSLDAASNVAHAAGAPTPPDRAPAEVPAARLRRWEREARARSQFVSSDEVFELRATVAQLRGELVAARRQTDADRRRVGQLEEELLNLNRRDAEFMHAVSSELMERARAAGDDDLAETYRAQVEDAQLCIPQLNMHGLWVGKYGSGYELINVTYSGDTLIATKVTGDRNVPKGEASFTVDLLSPFSSNNDGAFAPALEPIGLDPKAAQQWGHRYLPRFAGRGQVAAAGFENAQWMEGQMILVGRFFSFAWVPLGHQVFFGRPSAELVVKMMKEALAEELRTDHVAVMRVVAEGMWEETHWDQSERLEDNYYLDEGQGCFD